jgi:dTDP-glucose pyrophosphorylase
MKDLLIKSNLSVKEALRKLTKEGEKCLVVVDKENKLLGTLSDGDVRNAILKGAHHKDKINKFYQLKPTFFIEGDYSLSEAKNIFIKKRIDVIPILKRSKKVVDILTFEDFFNKNNTSNNSKNFPIKLPDKYSYYDVVIMAGGKGGRLEPFTNVLPKPLIPINEKPVIEHIIEKFIENKVSNFFITLNYKSKILKAFFQEMKPGLKLSFIDETKPLGTAGGLSLLKGKIKKPFLVTNCDTIININFDDLMNFHISNDNDITLVVSSKEHIIPYGTCKLTKEGYLKKIIEKPKFDFFVNVGLYVLNPDLIKLIPKNKNYDMTTLIQHAKRKKKQVGVYPIDDASWIDVGQWSEYHKAIEKLV